MPWVPWISKSASPWRLYPQMLATAFAVPSAGLRSSGLPSGTVSVVMLPVTPSTKVPDPVASRPTAVRTKSISPAKLPSPPAVASVMSTCPAKPGAASAGSPLKAAVPATVVSVEPFPSPSSGAEKV